VKKALKKKLKKLKNFLILIMGMRNRYYRT
jgi:hypothetical protein